MKHLEELEKELKELLISDIGDNVGKSIIANTSYTYGTVTKESKYPSPFSVEFHLQSLLHNRKILQAYDAIEERKGQLRFLLISNRGMMTLEQLANLIGTKLSDYEWEWLKQQEKENKDE